MENNNPHHVNLHCHSHLEPLPHENADNHPQQTTNLRHDAPPLK